MTTLNKSELTPVIQENFETEGIDIGRMKHTDLTQDLAIYENQTRDTFLNLNAEVPEGGIDRVAKGQLARRALKELVNPVISNTSNVANGGEYLGYGINTERLLRTAENVGIEYDMLQAHAKFAANKQKQS